MTKKPEGLGKTRTREHILADLAINHVERHVFRCGFVAERIHHDYGLVLYDGRKDKAYWLYVQAYFEAVRPLDLFTGPGRVTVQIPTSNRLNRRTVRRFRQFRDAVLAQTKGRIRHYD